MHAHPRELNLKNNVLKIVRVADARNNIQILYGSLLFVAACNRGDYGRQYLYYVRDGCDCTIFWQCERVRGQIVARRQQCPPCLCFSDDTWVCSDRVPPAPGQVCPTQAPVTEAISRVTGDKLSFMLTFLIHTHSHHLHMQMLCRIEQTYQILR